jgi:O-antigen/teichoic acid export membrane protein
LKNTLEMQVTDEARVTTRNLSALVFMKLLQYPFLFLFFILVPRVMGPELYGEYALFISIVMIGSSVTNFGGGSEIFGRFVPEFESRSQPDDIRKIFGNLVFLQNLFNLAAVLCMLLTLHFFYRDRLSTTYLILILLMVVIRNNYSMLYALLFGLNEIAKANSMLPIRRVLSLVLLIALFHYFRLTGAIVSTLVVDICLTIPAVYWTRKYFSLGHANLDWKFMKPYLVYGLVFFLSGGFFAIWQKLGNVFIERISHSTREVAIFDIPNQMFLLMVGFILPFIYALAPIFTKLLLEGKEHKIAKWSSIAGKYMAILCTATFFGFAVSGEQLFLKILGADFAGTYVNGVIQLGGIFPFVIASMGILLSMVYKKPRVFLAALFMTIASFAVAAALLIPPYGADGCAVAMLLSCFVLGIAMYLFFRKIIRDAFLVFVKTIACGVIFVPLLWIRTGLAGSLILFVVFTAIYLLILFVARMLSREEFRTIYRAIRMKGEPIEADLSA